MFNLPGSTMLAFLGLGPLQYVLIVVLIALIVVFFKIRNRQQ